MSKIILFAFAALLVATLISGKSIDKCGRHGDPCNSVADCCPTKQMACNRFAKRCQVQITVEELQEARKKLKHVEPKDRKGYTDIYSN